MSLYSITGAATVVYENGVIPNNNLNAGSIRHAGTAADATWNSMRLGDNTYDNDFSQAVSGVNTTGIAQGGTNEFGVVGHVIRLVTTDLAGVSNTTLRGTQSNSSERANTPAAMRTMRSLAHKLAIQANAWDEFSASWDTGYPQSFVSGTYDIELAINNASGQIVDQAANVSRANPGEYVFLVGGKTITSGTYESKTG